MRRPACRLTARRAARGPAARAAPAARRSAACSAAISLLTDERRRWRSASWPSIHCFCAARSATIVGLARAGVCEASRRRSRPPCGTGLTSFSTCASWAPTRSSDVEPGRGGRRGSARRGGLSTAPPDVAVDVERPEALRDVRTCATPRLFFADAEVARVRVELAVDLVELDVRAVVRLDRMREIRSPSAGSDPTIACACARFELIDGSAVADAGADDEGDREAGDRQRREGPGLSRFSKLFRPQRSRGERQAAEGRRHRSQVAETLAARHPTGATAVRAKSSAKQHVDCVLATVLPPVRRARSRDGFCRRVSAALPRRLRRLRRSPCGERPGALAGAGRRSQRAERSAVARRSSRASPPSRRPERSTRPARARPVARLAASARADAGSARTIVRASLRRIPPSGSRRRCSATCTSRVTPTRSR